MIYSAKNYRNPNTTPGQNTKIISTYDLYTGNIPNELKSKLANENWYKGLRDRFAGQQGNPFQRGTQANQRWNQINSFFSQAAGPNWLLAHPYELTDKNIANQAMSFGQSHLKGGRFYPQVEGAITPEEFAQRQAEDKRASATNQGGEMVGQTTAANVANNSLGDQSANPSGQPLATSGQSLTPQQRTLIDIANSRPDVLSTAKSQGGDPFTVGTPANRWLNDWWNTAGKNEYPNVQLVQPAVIGTGTPARGAEASQEEQKIIDRIKNKELSKSELEDLQTKKAIQDARTALGLDPETGIKKPAVPSYENDYATLRDKYSISAVESQINNINNQINNLQKSLNLGINKEYGRLAPMELINSRQRQLQNQAAIQLRALNARKQALISELNMKNAIVSNIMKFKQLDYNAAADEYNREFSHNIQLMNALSYRDYREGMELNRERDDARANLNTLLNLSKDTGKGWNDLDSEMKSQINALEIKAGIPEGTTKEFMQAYPDAKVMATTTSYDAAGNQIVSFIYQGKDGKPGAVEVVNTGGRKSVSGTGTTTAWKPSNVERAKLTAAGIDWTTPDGYLKAVQYLYGTPDWKTARKVISDNPSATDEQLRQILLEQKDKLHLSSADINTLLKNRISETELRTTALNYLASVWHPSMFHKGNKELERAKKKILPQIEVAGFSDREKNLLKQELDKITDYRDVVNYGRGHIKGFSY